MSDTNNNTNNDINNNLEYYDVFDLVDNKKINCLDDGFVELVDCMPRLVPIGRTTEFACVRNARVSYGDASLKTKVADDNLVKYMIRNKHTSPIESIELQLLIRAPKFVVIQILRHRTGQYNEVSQRYTEIGNNEYMHLSKLKKGDSLLPEGAVRAQSKINHQGSDDAEFDAQTQIDVDKLVLENEQLIDKLFDNYHKLIELGVAKECARAVLPMSTYSDIYMKMNLSNLMKFLALRMDHHAQAEIRIYANAIYNLVKQIAPVIFETFDEEINSIKLNPREIEFIKMFSSNEDIESNHSNNSNNNNYDLSNYKGSKTEKHDLELKINKLF